MTNIYTAKEGATCVITVCVQKVSASEVSFWLHRVSGLGGVKAQMASTQTRAALIAWRESRSGRTSAWTHWKGLGKRSSTGILGFHLFLVNCFVVLVALP